MARLSMVAKDERRKYLSEKALQKRITLRKKVSDIGASQEERFAASIALQKLPKNSAPARVRNRCKLTGRSRGYLRKFGLCRNEFRRLANFGQIPGVIKASW